MPLRLLTAFICALTLSSTIALVEGAPDLRFTVTFSSAQSATPLDGRVLLMVSTSDAAEPRFQICGRTQHAGDLRHRRRRPEAWADAIVDASALGYPIDSIAQIKPGKYYVQALLHKYETFRRSDGHVVKLPMDCGEGQQWTRAPGNLYSTPQQIEIDPRRADDHGRARQGHPADR